MQEDKLFQIFTDKFNELKSPYMVTGSVASIVYGEPSFTTRGTMFFHKEHN